MSQLEQWMEEAMAEARRAHGPCHPNPAVGALVVHEGQVVARGWTQAPGEAHAEVRALEAFAAEGIEPNATTAMIVTLEPCSTHGRTPPCTDAIIASGIKQIYIGATDTNPAHAGRGFRLLREAGITVTVGVRTDDCEALNLPFNHRMRTGCPLFAGKVATTLDGRIATREGQAKWITGEAARADVARWRRAFPAIAVGGGTIVADNPRLTARVPEEPTWCPRRLVFDRSGLCLKVPRSEVFTDANAGRTVYLATAEVLDQIPPAWKEAGVDCWPWTDWDALSQRCLSAGLTGIYVEGGAGLLSDLLQHRRLDYLFAYTAPKFLGDSDAPGPFSIGASTTMETAYRLTEVRHAVFGDDHMIRGRIEYPA